MIHPSIGFIILFYFFELAIFNQYQNWKFSETKDFSMIAGLNLPLS